MDMTRWQHVNADVLMTHSLPLPFNSLIYNSGISHHKRYAENIPDQYKRPRILSAFLLIPGKTVVVSSNACRLLMAALIFKNSAYTVQLRITMHSCISFASIKDMLHTLLYGRNGIS